MSSKPRGSRFKLFGLASSTVVPISECSAEGNPPDDKETVNDGSIVDGGGSPKTSQSFDSRSSFDSDISSQNEQESNCKTFFFFFFFSNKKNTDSLNRIQHFSSMFRRVDLVLKCVRVAVKAQFANRFEVDVEVVPWAKSF